MTHFQHLKLIHTITHLFPITTPMMLGFMEWHDTYILISILCVVSDSWPIRSLSMNGLRGTEETLIILIKTLRVSYSIINWCLANQDAFKKQIDEYFRVTSMEEQY